MTIGSTACLPIQWVWLDSSRQEESNDTNFIQNLFFESSSSFSVSYNVICFRRLHILFVFVLFRGVHFRGFVLCVYSLYRRNTRNQGIRGVIFTHPSYLSPLHSFFACVARNE